MKVREKARYLIDSGIKKRGGEPVFTDSAEECPMFIDRGRRGVVQR